MSEYQEPAHDLLEEAIGAFQRSSVPDRPLDTHLRARLNAESDEKVGLASLPIPGRRGRDRMRLLAPSAVAAAVLAGLGLWLLNGTAPLALADVVQAARQHMFVRYQQQQITDRGAETSARLDSLVYADFTAPRLYSETRVNSSAGESVLLSVHDGKHHLTTDSGRNTARLDFAPTGYKSVLCCLEDFQQMNGVTCENCELDGRTVVKYRHVEDKLIITLWVDAQSELPVRMEHERPDPSPGIARSTLVWTDFAWDPELPQGFGSLDDLFSTRPPAGYSLDDRTRGRNGDASEEL